MSNLTKTLYDVADVLIDHDQTKFDYEANQTSVGVIKAFIESNNMTKQHLNHVLIERDKFEMKMTKLFGVKFSKNPSVCWTQDLQKLMTKKGVSQKDRLVLGLFDTLVGELQTTNINVTPLYQATS